MRSSTPTLVNGPASARFAQSIKRSPVTPAVVVGRPSPMFICRRSFGGDDKFSRMSVFRGSATPTKSWNHFRFAVKDGVATITFDRSQKLNALTFQVYADLRDLLTELPQRDDVRVLVITGTGRGFSSGGDVNEIIGELQKMDPRDLLAFTRMTGTVTQRMRECPVPIIASVNGVAAGAGARGRSGARLRRDEDAGVEGVGDEPRRRARAGQHDTGAADEERRSRGVLRGIPRRTRSEMERPIASPHEIRNPDTLPPALGFSHAVIAQSGRTVYLAGQTAQQKDGTVVGTTMAEQFDQAADNVVKAL